MLKVRVNENKWNRHNPQLLILEKCPFLFPCETWIERKEERIEEEEKKGKKSRRTYTAEFINRWRV